MSKINYKIPIILLLFIILFSSLTVVSAGGARKLDLSNEKNKENANKIYSICKSYGLDDIKISGILGNFIIETGNIDFTSVEGIYNEPLQDDWSSNTAKGQAMANFNDYSYNILYNTIYAGNSKINKSAYKSNGKYWVGIGIGSWTGPKSEDLLKTAEKIQCDWFGTDFQLAYLFADSEDCFELFKKTNISTPTDAADFFYANHEMGWHPTTWKSYANSMENSLQDIPGRRASAELIYREIIPQLTYDKSYGDGALQSVELLKQGEKIPCECSLVPSHKEVSIYQEMLGGVTRITLTDGSSFLNPENNKEKINLEIYNSIKNGVSTTSSNSYSLYELFGSKVSFFQYLGEETTDTTLIDNIVNKLKNNEELALSDINYESTTYLSNRVYNNRPVPLNTDMVKSGYLDPRVKIYNEKMLNIVKVNLLFKANLLLRVGELIVAITNLFITNKFFAFIVEWFNKLALTKFWQEDLPTILQWLIPLFIIAFIFSIIAYAVKFTKGQAGIKQVLVRLITGIVALGIISVAILQTVTINNIIIIGTTLIDDVFAESLEEIYDGDEVIASNIKDSSILDKDINTTTEAAIWKVAIFQPWCIGMFGDKYENLYTQFSNKPDKNKFAQSYEDIENLDKSDEEAHFDSATATGDVVVDVGGGKQIRNWAAYAWSCQSTYHVDHSIWEDEITIEDPVKTWVPAAKTADGTIYADTFRVIDAKMNISPQYYSDGTEIISYSDSNYFELHLMKAIVAMIVRIALLMVMWPTIIRKVSSFLQLILTAIKFVYYSFIELWKEGAGYSLLFPQFKHYFSQYIYSSMQLYILIFLYTSFIDKGFLWMIAYLILAYAVINVKVSDLSSARLKVRTFRKRHFG